MLRHNLHEAPFQEVGLMQIPEDCCSETTVNDCHNDNNNYFYFYFLVSNYNFLWVY